MAAEDWIGGEEPDDWEGEPRRHLCGEQHDVLRHNRETGELFIGCNQFPKCRYTRPLFYVEDYAKTEADARKET